MLASHQINMRPVCEPQALSDFSCRRRLALMLERGAYWRTPKKVRTPINGTD